MTGVYQPGNVLGAKSAMEIVVSNFEYIQSTIEDVKYPDFLWNKVLPIQSLDTNINPGANLSSYRLRDKRGQGNFRAKNDQNLPTVSVSFQKRSVFIENAGVSAFFDNQDAREYEMGYAGQNLMQEYGNCMREASDRHIEQVFFFGDASVDFTGFINAPEVPIATAATKAAGGTSWDDATPDEILYDVNEALSQIYVNTKQVFIPDTVYLPPRQLALIAGLKAGTNANDYSVLRYIKENNFYTQTTGKELNVEAIRYLENAGTAPANSNRMRVVTKDPDVYYMAMPLPLQMVAPQYAGLGVKLFAEYRFSNVALKYPTSQINVDGI